MNEQTPEKPKPSIVTGALGAQVFSLFVPCMLIYWTNAGSILGSGKWDIGGLTFLVISAVILCSPGTLVLGVILVGMLPLETNEKGEALRRNLILSGAIIGGVLAFFNLPAYLGFIHVNGLKFLPILGLGGSMAGAWIGWRVFCRAAPPQPFLPRFSLGSLMLFVLAWATIFFLYAPGVW